MTGLTQKDRKALTRGKAMGKACVLAVGVGKQIKNSGFEGLKTCVSDANEIAQTFKDTSALMADPDRVHVLTSEMDGGASRGVIIGALKRLANDAEEGERLIFFFSGHGWRIEDELFLVPQDAYSSDDKHAHLAFADVEAILNESKAKQKIVLLDACLSGPDTSTFKAPLTNVSEKFFADYLEATHGLVRLSAATSDTIAHTQSPNPKHSLFTHYLLAGLRGEPDALEDSKLLTVSSLFQYVSVQTQKYAKSAHISQKPSIKQSVDGVIVLGDFGGTTLQTEGLAVAAAAERLIFSDEERARIKDFLPNMRRKYTHDYLEGVINQRVLPAHFKEQFGRLKSALRNRYSYGSGDVTAEDNTLLFPDGKYSVEFLAENDKSGVIKRSVELEQGWLNRPGDLEELLDVFGMSAPEEMVIVLRTLLKVQQTANMLRAQGWVLELESDDRALASRMGFKLEVRRDALTIRDFVPSELFGSKADKNKAGLLHAVLSGLAPPVKPQRSLAANLSVRTLERVPREIPAKVKRRNASDIDDDDDQ